jgi:hypothetical protein
LCFSLSACGGGGGGGIASIPPPPPPPPTGASVTSIDVQKTWLQSPATRAGSYDLIGRLTLTSGSGGPTSNRALAPGEFTMSTSKSLVYTLNAPAGLLPGGLSSISEGIPVVSWDFNAGGPNYRYDNPWGDYSQSFGQNLKENDVYSDGTKKLREDYDYSRGSATGTQSLGAGKNLQVSLLYDLGNSYVAMGEWSWQVVDLNGAAAGDYGDLLFVNGDRTPSSGIPASGTATYNARTLKGWVTAFTLTANFGQRTISTIIDQDYQYNPAGDIMDNPLAAGIHVAGSAPFSNNGSFDIPLTGTANFSSGYDINTPQPPPGEPVSGTMDGAFFGPHAEQVGGVLALDRSNGTLMLQDAFVGQQPGH